MANHHENGFWKLNFDPQVKHLVDREHDLYLSHKIEGMHPVFKLA